MTTRTIVGIGVLVMVAGAVVSAEEVHTSLQGNRIAPVFTPDEGESVDLYRGDATYTHMLYDLVGRNGMDMEIALHYCSNVAPTVWTFVWFSAETMGCVILTGLNWSWKKILR